MRAMAVSLILSAALELAAFANSDALGAAAFADPEPPPQPAFAFALLGGLDMESPATPQFARAVSLLSPDFTIILGETKPSPQDFSAQPAAFSDRLEQALLPFPPFIYFFPSVPSTAEPPTWTAFRRSGSLFIIMLEDPRLPEISQDELSWLIAQLEAEPSPEHIFVCTSRPLWRDGRTTDIWNSSVHPLLASAGADLVIAYKPDLYAAYPARDGVRYVATGGGINPSGNSPTGFPHFLLVTVRGPDAQLAVIRPDAVLPENAVSAESVSRLQGILQQLSEPLVLPATALQSPTGPRPFTIQRNLANPFDSRLHVSASWELPPGWTASPVSVSLEPGEGLTQPLQLVAPPGALMHPLPSCTWYLMTFQPGSSVPLRARGTSPLVVAFAAASWLPLSPSLDGSLEEWPTPLPISLASKEHLVSGADFWKGPHDASASAAVGTDGGWLYVAVSFTDDQLTGGVPGEADTIVIILGQARITANPSPDLSYVWFNVLSDQEPELELTAQTAGVLAEGKMNIEVKIPLSTLEKIVHLSDDHLVPFDLFLVDVDEGGAEYSLMSWTGLSDTWQTQHLQGRIRLGK